MPASPEKATAEQAIPGPQAPAVPPECNPHSPCVGSTCAAAVTTALATTPTDACPRFGEFQSDVDVYSWNTFIAVNWPADTSTCQGDTSRSILSGQGPVVWETWALASDVFVSPGSQPAAWCPSKSGGPRTFGELRKASSQLTESFPNFNEAFGAGPVTDQTGRFVRFEKRLNLDEYNYLTVNNLWNKAGQQGAAISFPSGPGQEPSPCGNEPCGPTGAMEVKAAWKVLSDAEIASGRFYTTQGIVFNDAQGHPSPGKLPVTLGLVGLHIIHKTKTQQTWFWSTFEQVDNATNSFFNPSCTNCPANQQTARTPYTELDAQGTPINGPVQVTRVTPIESDAPALNAYYQGLLAGSVWQYYQLIGTQWATGGAPEGTASILANTVIETFFQGSSSCFGCHQAAQSAAGTSADFSYLMMEAQ